MVLPVHAPDRHLATMHYPELIQETPEELAQLERKNRSGPLEARLKMLRSGQAAT